MARLRARAARGVLRVVRGAIGSCGRLAERGGRCCGVARSRSWGGQVTHGERDSRGRRTEQRKVVVGVVVDAQETVMEARDNYK